MTNTMMKVQILETLYVKINKPSLNKIDFKYSSHILKCLLHFSCQSFLLPLVNFFSSINYPLTCSSSYSLYKFIQLTIVLVISLFAFLKMARIKAKYTLETYGTFLNSLHPRVKPLIQRLEQIKNKIDRHEVSIFFNQTYLKEKILLYTHTHTHKHIYIYIYKVSLWT